MTLDLWVIGLYVFAMLALGAWAVKRTRTREDYLVAGRNLGPGFYLGSMAATVLGGASTIGSVRLGYLHGISAFWLCATLGLGTLGVNLLLAKPLLKLKIFTVTQVLGRRYTPATRQASAVIMLAYTLMLTCTSVIAIGTIFQVLFDWPFGLAALAGGAVVVLYCSLGGMWSLTLTDIVQFLIMTIGLVFILLPLSISEAGGWQTMMNQLPESMFSFTGIGGDTIVTWFLIYFLGIFIGQDIWQRIFTARSTRVARGAGSFAGVYCILYGLAMAFIGMATRIILPDLDNANNAFAAIVQHSLPAGLRGLVIAAALAALMSTASAGLLAASTTLSQDLLPVVWKDVQRSSSVQLNRFTTFVLGIVVLGISLLIQDIVGALTVAYNLLVGGMLVPLLGALFWKKASTRGAITSMVLGATTVVALMIKDGILANTSIYYGLTVSLISFLMQPKADTKIAEK